MSEEYMDAEYSPPRGRQESEHDQCNVNINNTNNNIHFDPYVIHELSPPPPLQ